jgi:hypothetical protein
MSNCAIEYETIKGKKANSVIIVLCLTELEPRKNTGRLYKQSVITTQCH